MISTRYFGNWNTQTTQVSFPFPLSLGVSSLVVLIFLDLEQVFLWSPQDQLHSWHLIDGLEQSLPRCPSALQLKHPVKHFALPLENTLMCSSSLLSFQLSLTVPMSMAFRSGICYRPILIFPDFFLFFWFSRVTFAFSPYLLAPITRNHQMLKSPHSPDPFASWVPCVLQCASCSPHSALPITHGTQPRTCSLHDSHMRTTYLTLPSWLASLPLHGCTDTFVILMYVRLIKELCSIAYRLI